MHILVINDDGPPSQKASPYIHSLIKLLQASGHTVSVVLPNEQRSWIGKAHFVAVTIKPTYYRPGTLHQDDGTVHARPSALGEDEKEEWVLLNGTPASCAQLGLYHFFQDRGPVDLVVSGPNYGRNSTALFSLSSGTLGGAMEAAMCRKKAIALSFAYVPGEHNHERIAAACMHSIKLIQYLYDHWAEGVDLYAINVPLIDGVETHKIMYTHTLQNYWTSGSSFQEIDATEDDDRPESREKDIRESEETSDQNDFKPRANDKQRHFKWAPRFPDIHKSIENNPPGNDGWAIGEGHTSVVPLQANFMHASSVLLGELKLSPSTRGFSVKTITSIPNPKFYAFINYEDAYVEPLILRTLATIVSPASYALISSLSSLPTPTSPVLQIRAYETIDFTHLLAHPTTSIANAYITRKALIRKHYLARTISAWNSKRPNNPLPTLTKPTLDFELDYSDFLDEALLEAYELHESFARNRTRPPENQEWWILKPGMSDRGQGIRLFSTETHLRSIFEEWDPDSDSDSGPEPISRSEIDFRISTQASRPGIITSHLRHFIVQPYIDPPLLLPEFHNRKFHLRSYVLALGALRVYIYDELLALFATQPYQPPSYPFNSDIHLTNTCLRAPTPTDPANIIGTPNIALFSTLPSPPQLPGDWKSTIKKTIAAATGELFLAAARTQSTHFQLLPNAFEIFGVDWLLDAHGAPWLLEVNAFPDFAQSGHVGKEVVQGVWEGALRLLVAEGGFLGGGREDGGGVVGTGMGMQMVLDVDLGRR